MRLQGSAPVPATTGMRPQARREQPAPEHLRVAQLNLFNLFDTVDDPDFADEESTPTPEQYQIKLTKIARAIEALGTPDVISVNEIENETVLRDLLAQPALKDAGYRFVVQPTNDARGITVGVLYKGERLELAGQTTVNPKMSFQDGGAGQVDRSLLFARPPLVVDFKVRGAAQAAEGAGLFTMAINHFKSKRGGEAPEDRRQMQGQFLGEWLDARTATQQGGATIVVGDLNANHGDGAYEKLAKRPDGSTRFYDAPLKLAEGDRYTYIHRGEKNLLDHLMVTAGREDAIAGVEVLHLNTPEGARDSEWDPAVVPGFSDHDPLVVDLDLTRLVGTRPA